MATAPPERRRRFKRNAIVAVIIVVAVVVPTFFLLHVSVTGGAPPTVTISGSVTCGYGTPTGVAFMKQNADAIPYFAYAVNGTYSITVPNNTVYAAYINFQPPSGSSGTDGGFTIELDSAAGNSSVTHNLSCQSTAIG